MELLRPVPKPGVSPQRWPGELSIGKCASGLGNDTHLQESRMHVSLAMQIEVSAHPSATVQ